MHFPDTDRTIWHISFGTYGTRLHGGVRPTVDRRRNAFGEPVNDCIPRYEQVERDRLVHPPRFITAEQRTFIEATLPVVCERGGWELLARVVAVDHMHLLLVAPRMAEGKTIRTLIKRWLSQKLQERTEAGPWWAEGGSNKVVDCPEYLESVKAYLGRHS